MADIVNPEAIKFSNESARTLADGLAACYYQGNLAKQMYDGAGGGATALAVASVVAQIRRAATQWRQTFSLCFERETEWFLKGATALIPNTADVIVDGAPADRRQIATGAKVVAVMARVTEFVNAVRNATFTFATATRTSVVHYNRIIVVSDLGLSTMSVADAQNFVDDTALLKTNYEATTNANLNQLLALAVNPNTTGV